MNNYEIFFINLIHVNVIIYECDSAGDLLYELISGSIILDISSNYISPVTWTFIMEYIIRILEGIICPYHSEQYTLAWHGSPYQIVIAKTGLNVLVMNCIKLGP